MASSEPQELPTVSLLLRQACEELEVLVLPCEILPSEYKQECRERNHRNHAVTQLLRFLPVSEPGPGKSQAEKLRAEKSSPRPILKKSGTKSRSKNAPRKRVRWKL